MADLFGIVEGVLGKIASLALQEAVAIYGVENQISELRETLTAIKAVLSDAEEQQMKNHSLQLWLDRLQDVLYDAEDVLDELECEALRKKVISRYGGIKGKVCQFFSNSNPLIFRAKISHNITEIREILSRISADNDQFGLLRGADNSEAHMPPREITDPFVKKSNVVGRDIDKKKIIDMLLPSVDDKSISVIPIVGIGGLGKTTLAKIVYDDDKDFDLKKVIEEIIKHATGQSFRDVDIRQLQTHLLDIIKDKKYLLVLDDVWSNDHRKWRKLRDLLSEGAGESKIIVTTRNSEIASNMGTHPAHNLEGLSDEDSMALLKKCAFGEKETQPRHDLLEIGKAIVAKCQGVPLLVETLGSLLNSKDDAGDWIRIRDSETWELAEAKKDILPVLKLSYVHLPSHLKQCFPILSLFPRGVQFQASHLIGLWMALGLISSKSEKLAPEDIGVEYVKELRRRSLIQDVEDHGTVLLFKLHDLVHSLATSVGQNYCLTVDSDTPEISERVRCISLPNGSLEGISNYDGVPSFLGKKTSKRLRAIFLPYGADDGVITRKFVKAFISNCKHLRYLRLSFGCFKELPNSICNLKQLRSLDLSENKRLKKLPDTICELPSLLELNITGCLELDELPKNMNKLVSLRFLYITTKQKSLQETGIQYLENLHFLGLYACENLQVLFEGTCRLTRLRELEIRDCGGPISLPFGELIALESLNIAGCKLALTSEIKPNFPLSLRNLVIDNSEQVMEIFRCLEGSAFTLESFSVFDCPSLTIVPEWLPNHTRLGLIHLIRCPNLSFMPQRIRSLTALKELRIEHRGELSKRCEPQTGKDWNIIAHVPRIALDLIGVQWTDD
ncbi:putative disease resistance protein RGA4 [Rhodamnia argentea]|uniref:Disease resistance protein RGA4 n=1 Tax=Rhodamnia argentea TaxID=178133 RepID=A0ABM3HPM3_9MYRT|nr:putative disease resistance protein RGA4 [Rhodamnia argentea]